MSAPYKFVPDWPRFSNAYGVTLKQRIIASFLYDTLDPSLDGLSPQRLALLSRAVWDISKVKLKKYRIKKAEVFFTDDDVIDFVKDSNGLFRFDGSKYFIDREVFKSGVVANAFIAKYFSGRLKEESILNMYAKKLADGEMTPKEKAIFHEIRFRNYKNEKRPDDFDLD